MGLHAHTTGEVLWKSIKWGGEEDVFRRYLGESWLTGSSALCISLKYLLAPDLWQEQS